MGSVLASAILDRAGTTLLDTAATRWSDADKLIYLNDGQRLAVMYKSDANAVIYEYLLVTGTKQQIPDGSSSFRNPSSVTLPEGLLLLDLIRNMGVTGIVVGSAIDPVDLQELNAFNSDWHAATANAVVQSYAYDERYPGDFFVYPPQPASPGYVTAAYSALVSNLPSLSFTFVDGDVTVAADTIAEIGHGMAQGQAVILSSTATLPAGLSVETIYYVIRIDANTFQLATSLANAMTSTEVDITAAAGGGTHTLSMAINLSDRYQTTLYYYVVHRCYDKDAALSPYNNSESVKFWNMFVTELGRLDLIKKAVSPNAMQPKPSPSLKEA